MNIVQTLQDFFNSSIGTTIWNLIIAFVILIVGYIVARIIASLVRRLLGRTRIDDRIADTLSEPDEQQKVPVEDTVGRITFWVIMIFVIVAFLDRLNLSGISAPLSLFLDNLMATYLPRLFAAGVLLVVAWLVASVLRILVRKGAHMLKLDNRLSQYGALEEGEQVSFSEPLAEGVFWFTFLLFIPAVLNALGITSIAEPIQSVFNDIFAYLPNIIGAAVIALIGWFIARIIRRVIVGLLKAIGTDKFGARFGISETQSLAEIIGTIIYVVILFVVIIAALGQLDIPAISDPLTLMLTQIVNTIPALIGALLILFLAYFIGRIIANLVGELLANVGFNALPNALGLQWSATRKPSDWAASLLLIVIMIFAATAAVEILGSQFLVDALDIFIDFLWKLFLAVVILVIGLYFARMAHRIVSETGINNAGFLARLAQVAVILFSAAIALRELAIANDIINLAFGIALGSMGIAAAIAFGVGGRHIAGEELERWVGALRAPVEESSAPEETDLEG